ncbi:PhzF family phenazine biosynthesis protein [Nocardia salmonicida]|uniref:PhzF family phenazine biosynthesis protein n=1 Tax=Nocardia salmonicida TaxID=53431 RepID=UPI0033FCFB45
MVAVEVVRVFTDPDGKHGNPLGVVVDGASIADPNDRQALAARLGYSETIFIDGIEQGSIQIFSPTVELPFAGHPTVGAAWVLARELGRHPDYVLTASGQIRTWSDDGVVWIRGPLASTPPWWHERLNAAGDVEALSGPLSPAQDATQLWAWQDEQAGAVRARVFAARYGVVEDEACGSASMRLAAALGRRLTIHHGEGSVVFADHGPPGTADVGGLVSSDGRQH